MQLIKYTTILLLVVTVLSAPNLAASGVTSRPEIHWTAWSPAVFAQAQREQRLLHSYDNVHGGWGDSHKFLLRIWQSKLLMLP